MGEENKNWIREKLEEAFHAAVLASLNSEKAKEKAATVTQKYPGMPKDALAHILTKQAARKTMVEGAANGAAITAVESTLASPEPASKPLVVSGVAGLIVSDVAYTTKVQMQLLLEIGEIYECPFDIDDEDDVWLILKTSFGLRGTERVGAYGRFVFTEAARKQFRAFLRNHGIRRAAQKAVAQIAGKEVAKHVSERALLRLIPFANAVIGAVFNRWVTLRVGYWAKVKAKIRASTFGKIDALSAKQPDALVLVLPTIFLIGTADDRLVDNTLTLYAQAAKRANLSLEQIKSVDAIIHHEEFEELLFGRLKDITDRAAKEDLLDIAITSASAARLAFSSPHHEALERLSKQMDLTYIAADFERRISYLTKQ